MKITKDGEPFDIYQMHIIDDIQYPVGWFFDPENRAAMGLVEEEDDPVPIDIPALKAAKNIEINAWRAAANVSTFPYSGKEIACDALSRSDIDGVANHIGLFNTFPEGFPGAWKATDNTFLLMPDTDTFRAMYAAMTAQGTANFNHSQQLKAALAAAATAEEVAAIVWGALL